MMPRTVKEILAQADDLAARFEEDDLGPERVADGASLRQVRVAFESKARAERDLTDAVTVARAEGHSWVAIGAMVGTSGEAARQRYGAPGLLQVITAIRESWDQHTSGYPDQWTLQNPACGQCTVSALVLHDHCGGVIMEFVTVSDDISHYHDVNVIDGMLLDVTFGQFQSLRLTYVSRESRPREMLLWNDSTRERYERLSQRVTARLREQREET
jgi:hypothetical protein